MKTTTDILPGARYNSLTVIKRVEDYVSPKGNHAKKYLCKCDCGEEVITRGSWLKCGKTVCCKKCSKEKEQINKTRDLSHCRFGRWTVLEKAETNKKGVYWKCRCDCGTEKIIRGTSLTSGNSTSCGCFASERARNNHILDLTGKRFGRLTVIEQVDDYISAKNGKHLSRWKCVCDCGNIIDVNGAYLTSGNTNSCGCYKLDQTSKIHFKDITGERFGMLTVLKRVDDYVSPKDGRLRVQFLCQCDCGNQKIIQKESLMNGTISCGCINSKGEREIAEFLQLHKINYKIQYSFSDLIGEVALKFDFAIFDELNNLLALVEYQGEQHYAPVIFFGGEKKFEKQKQYDNKKRLYCQQHNLRLIEIPYWDKPDKYLLEFCKKKES